MAKHKFYAVRKGHVPGIYTDWDTCKTQVTGFPGAKYKSFSTREDAEAYLNGNAAQPANNTDAPQGDYAFVDGSWNDATKTYGYGGFVVIDGVEHVIQGSGDDEDMASMRNVAGEIAGAMAAARFALEHGCKQLTLLHDYLGIAKWVNSTWRAQNDHTREYRDYMRSIDALMPLSFRHVKGHTGIEGNERADKLAKQAVGIE